MLSGAKLRFVSNADARKTDPCADILGPFSAEEIEAVQTFHRSFPSYQATPLQCLDRLAGQLGISKIWIKDESQRFGLNAFKVLGASYAVARFLMRKFRMDDRPTFETFLSSVVKSRMKKVTFVTATDGNHGRAVAWIAGILGCRAEILMPDGSSDARIRDIRSHGASVHVIDGNYDDAVRAASSKAAENGWILIQDTAREDYEVIPGWIMQGYVTLLVEALEQLRGMMPTHIIAQCGVGSFSGSLLAYTVQAYGLERPHFVVVEPESCACYTESMASADRRPRAIGGDLHTAMASLSCGEPSTLAWEILSRYADGFIASPDRVAVEGVDLLGHPISGDPPLVSGPSGAVTTGVLRRILADPANVTIAESMGFDENARVLLISTEGDIDSAP